MALDFYPPRERPFCLRLARLVAPAIARYWRGIERVEIAPEDRERLAALRNQRFLLCANHPTLTDPLVIFEVGRRLELPFNYMAARELFRRPLGWVLQAVGAYSVLRGTPDREAIRTTRHLLAREDRKVVVFPEGLTYEHNDRLLPFHEGVIQMGFWALEDLEKLGKEARLPVVPVAVKYLFVGDAGAAIEASLSELERALGLEPAVREDPYRRLRAVGERLLERIERELGLIPAPGMPVEERITAARESVMERVARALGVRVPAGGTLAEKLHALDNALDSYANEFATGRTAYERRQHARRAAAAEVLARDVSRLHNFIAVSDGYVAEVMTAERCLDVLSRLEIEVLGRPRRRGRRQAVVRVGEPLELGEYRDEYRRGKRAAVAAATAELQRRIQTLLEALSALGTPMAASSQAMEQARCP